MDASNSSPDQEKGEQQPCELPSLSNKDNNVEPSDKYYDTAKERHPERHLQMESECKSRTESISMGHYIALSVICHFENR
jgi:hypothetical protein